MSNRYLIVGLGNIGQEYERTRHNAGFMVLDHLALRDGATPWEDHRYGFTSSLRIKNRQLILLKPSTYMNLSGNAVRYWVQKEEIEPERLLVVVDDLALPFGQIRLRGKGGAAGHNGLGHIAQILGREDYARLRFGIGNDFPRGGQVDYVLSRFTPEEMAIITPRLDVAADAVREFCLSGIGLAMTRFNSR